MKFSLNTPIHWASVENHVLINPKFPPELMHTLIELLQAKEVGFCSHVFILSSGTTASQFADFKWVAMSKEALLASAAAVNAVVLSHSEDLWLQSIPDFHVGGVGIRARAFLSGAQVIPFASVARWSARDFVAVVLAHSVTLTSLVPAQVYDLVSERLPCPPKLRAVFIGGAALASPLYCEARRLGWPLLPTYGMTETGSQIATASFCELAQPSSRDHFPSLEILPHLSVRALAGDDRLEIKGTSLLSAFVYRHDQRCMIGDPKSVDGWYTSEDRAEVADGCLRILGRIGELIKIGGERVEMSRLREILDGVCLDMKMQADVALLAVEDDRLGYVIHLVSDERLRGEPLQALVEAYNVRVLGFERVRKSHLLPYIPRTSLGKLKSVECLRMIREL